MAHAFAPDLGPGDLDTAALADDAAEADPLVLTAVALPVLGRTEDLLAEQPVLLRTEGPVVDRLRLLDLAVGPGPDRVGGSQPDPKLFKVVYVQHLKPSFTGPAGVFFIRAPLRPADGDAALLRRPEERL